MEKDYRVRQWDTIRILCTFIIICYHISCEIQLLDRVYCTPFFNTANGAWGAMIVSTFFALSGTTLFHVYARFDNKQQIFSFYKNRIKDIMIPFWITWLAFYIIKSFMLHDLSWGGVWSKIIFSVLGIDGYVYYLGSNYTLIGEWFFGAIVILYVIYPLVIWGFNKNKILWTGIIFSVYILLVIFNPFKMAAYRNIITCLWTFWIGMFLGKYREFLDNIILGIMGIVISIIVIFVHIPLPPVMVLPFGGISLYIAIYYVFSQISMRFQIKDIPILYKASFIVYLVHHQIIYHSISFISNFITSENTIIKIILYGLLIYGCGCVYYIIYKKGMGAFIFCLNKMKILESK